MIYNFISSINIKILKNKMNEMRMAYTNNDKYIYMK